MNRAIDNVKFMMRNPKFITEFIRNGYMTRHVMDVFRKKKENTFCAFCGTRKKIQIHHIIPVSVDDTLADRQDNMIALCHRCHFTVGHGNNYKSFMINVKQLCKDRRLAVTKPSEEL